ncbi:MAG: response regulator [Anaerolineae bacterium]|nr:MAG: response regulator [Anaerolineae bacterium]MCL4879953.1 response regulator [Anaerolineae bacterium]
MSALVLYIEDDDNNRVLVERVLKAEGYRVITASRAETGIALAMEHLPDIILMDINMPEIDGFMATARLRAVATLKDVPIVAVTANVMKGDREQTLAAGCDGYIPKPIDIDTFPSEIETFLQQGK